MVSVKRRTGGPSSPRSSLRHSLRAALVALSYGCKVPAGIFVPSMAIGASFGRMVGILVQWLQESFPNSQFFSACEADVACITPGTYAFLGAAGALSGIMHITISVVVIMFELTGALTYILPTMIVVGVTKAVGDRLSKGGIADRMIWFNGFPFLDNKEEHIFGVPTSQVMTTNVTLVPATGMAVKEVQKLLSDTAYSGFPIVEDMQENILVGYIGRTELQFAMNRAKKQGMLSPDTKCLFTTPIGEEPRTPFTEPPVTFDHMALPTVDFSTYVDSTPITVHPRLPLETAMELFKKMGPRVILVEHHGQVDGLVTVKDCLKYQFKAEALEHAAQHDEVSGSGQQEKLWTAVQGIGIWFADRLNNLSRGRLKLSPRTTNGWARAPDPRRTGHADDYTNEREILDGTETEFIVEDDDDNGVEMDVR